MKKKSLIYLFAIGFSLLFSFLYFFIFHFYIGDNTGGTSLVLSMNQIGIYKEEENAQAMEKSLESKGFAAYIYNKEDLYVVVSGIGDHNEANNNALKLEEAQIPYVSKQLEIKDAKTIALAEAKNYEKVLELIQNKSEGNAK